MVDVYLETNLDKASDFLCFILAGLYYMGNTKYLVGQSLGYLLKVKIPSYQ